MREQHKGTIVEFRRPAGGGKPAKDVTTDDLRQAMKDVFKRRAAAQQQGHGGDIEPRAYPYEP